MSALAAHADETASVRAVVEGRGWGSFGGWIVGSLISVGFTGGPAFLALPWLGLGAGQLPALARAIHHHRARSRAMVIVGWVLVSTIGGGLAAHATTWTGTTAVYLNVEHHLGGIGAGVARQMLVIAVVYGLPTGSFLLWITRQAHKPN